MHWKITALWGGKKVELRETQRAVTPFGGLVVFFEFLRLVGYREAVSQHLPFRLTSPNAIDPVETFTAFLLSVVAGARRFAHTSLLRADVALHSLLGIRRFPVDDTIRNLFKRFGQGQCQRFFFGLWSWQGAGRSAFSAARLAAERQLRNLTRGSGIPEGSPGVAAGKTCVASGTRRRGLL